MQLIHQIWIGDEIPKELYQKTIELKQMNPEFKYKLWGNEALEQYNLDNIPSNISKAFIVDILRLKILHDYGGIYIDVDYESILPLSELGSLLDADLAIYTFDTNNPLMIKYSNGFMIATVNYDFSELIDSYDILLNQPIIWNLRKFLKNRNFVEIPESLVGEEGSILKDLKLRSWDASVISRRARNKRNMNI
jgi:hypothetical protein